MSKTPGPMGGALSAEATEPSPERPSRPIPVHVGYTAAGLVIGGIWALNSGEPLWLHAAKTLALVLTIPFAIQWLRTRHDRRTGASGRPRLSLPRLVTAKLSLVAAALTVNWALAGRVTGADYITAAALAVTVALLGPPLLKPSPDGPVSSQDAQSHRATPKTRHRQHAIVIAIVAAIVVTALAAGELTARQTLEDRIATALQATVGGSVSVGIGATPALVDLAKGSISNVSVTVDGLHACKLGDVTLTASFQHVTRSGAQVRIASSQARMLLPPSAITAALGQANPRLSQATVQPDPATGTLAIALGPGGVLTADERPVLDGDAVRFAPEGVLLNDAPAPASLARSLTAKAAFTIPLPYLPMNLTARSVQVTRDGLVLIATGGHATFGPGSGPPAARPTC
jgi:LmeA-like phospholipid-binding